MELQNYVDWNVKSVIKLLERNNYGYLVILIYADGTKQTRQDSGFATKKAAEEAKKITIGKLVNGTYVVNNDVKVKDFLDYWLEYDIRRRAQSSNTYDTYSNIARNHIIPILGNKKLTKVNKGDVQRLYKDRAGFSKHIVRLVKTVNANIIPEEIPELLSYMDEVMPKKFTDDNAESDMLNTVIDIDGFLPKREASGNK